MAATDAAVCAWLLERAAARAVWLFGPSGRLEAQAPLDVLPPSSIPDALTEPSPPSVLQVGDEQVLLAPLTDGRWLAIRFDAGTSLGLVRVRARKAAAALAAGALPGGGQGGAPVPVVTGRRPRA